MLKTDKENLTKESSQQKPLRIWPGVVIVILQWLVRFGLPVIVPETLETAVFAGLFGGLALILWWAFFSRASHADRWSAIALMAAALYGIWHLIDESLATGGQGMMYIIYAVPVLSLAFIIWAVTCSRLADEPRRALMAAAILLGCGVMALIRVDGITGDFNLDLAWRWADTAEERLLARESEESMAPYPDEAVLTAGADWPGFRGSKRDGAVHGVRISDDWTASPPAEMWRKPVGPGCSSFAVRGGVFYTQEQRGDYETVSCYVLETGQPVWKHHDKARFWDSHAGAGPRSTPVISGGRIYTLGAAGILNALDARSGSVIWSRNAADDAGTMHSGWGYCGSPLVVEDVVITASAGRLAAYDTASGTLRWMGPEGGESYSSPHLLNISGAAQILLMSTAGAVSLSPADGSQLWNYSSSAVNCILQPAVTEDGDLLLIAAGKKGMHRLSVKNHSGEWIFEERWTSRRLRPDFNDFVVHNNCAFGFNGPKLACISIIDGARKWSGGRYGNGQLILLAEQGLLLVLSEAGGLALVEAVQEKFTELAHIPAISGKTWNHPVLAGNILLVRNTQEMAAFRLKRQGS